MKNIYKILSAFSLLVILLAVSSCGDSENTYIEGGNSDIESTQIELLPELWEQKTDSQTNQLVPEWYQDLILSHQSVSLTKDGVVLAFLRNVISSKQVIWEALPITDVLYDKDGILYTEQLWYSYNQEGVYFDFKNTHPTNPLPPYYNYTIKLIIIDVTLNNSLMKNNIDKKDYHAVMNYISTHSENYNMKTINI